MSRKRRDKRSSGAAAAEAHSGRSRLPLGLVALVAVTAVMPIFAGRIFVGDSTGFYGTGPLVWMGLLIVGAFSAAVLDAIRKGELTFPRTGLLVGVALLVIGSLAAIAGADNRYNAILGAVEVCLGVLYFLTVLLVVDSRENIRWLLAALVAGAFVAAAAAVVGKATFADPRVLAEYFRAYRLEILADQGMQPDSPEEEMYKIRMANDVVGTFYHPNLLASYLAMGFLAAVALVVGHAKGLWTKIGGGQRKSLSIVSAFILCFGIVAMGVAMWLTRSRAAVAAAIAGVYVLCVLGFVRSRLRRGLLLVVPAAVALVVLAVAWRGDLAPGALKSLRFRWDYWQGAWGVIRDHPIWGVGAENFGSHYPAHKLAYAPEEIKDPHNILVRSWVELGLAGLVGVVALVALAFRESLRRTRPLTEPRPAVESMWPALVATGLVAALINLAFRLQDLASGRIEAVGVEWVFSLVLLTGLFVAGIGAGHEDEPPLWERSRRWIRCGIIAALLAFGLQALVSFNFSELPTAAGAYLLLGLLVATGEGRRVRWPWLARRGPRMAASLVVLCLILSYTIWILLPVSESLRELARAEAISKTVSVDGLPGVASQEYREALDRAAEKSPQWMAWTKPQKLLAESHWHAMLAAQSSAAALRRRAAALPPQDSQRRRLLSAAERAQAAARKALDATRLNLQAVVEQSPREIETWRLLVQVDRALADDYDLDGMKQETIDTMQGVVDLYPTRAHFRAEFAELLDHYGRRDKARRQAREALRLDDVMPDPLRKLPERLRLLCRRLAGPAGKSD